MPNKDEAPLQKTGIQALDKLMSNINDHDRWQAQLEKVDEIGKQLDEGAPIPAADPRDVKQLWEATRRMDAEMPRRGPKHAVGLAVIAGYGVEAAASPDKFIPISWRHQLLKSLVERGVLNDYKHGEELDEKVSRWRQRCRATRMIWAKRCFQ